MAENIDKKGFYQSAMYHGTLLGVVWCVMYVMLIAGSSNLMMLLISSSLGIASPFIAAYFAKKYRREVCGNIIPYPRALLYLIIMYLCATLLSTVILFIYINYIDDGSFMNILHESIAILQDTPEVDKYTAALLEEISVMFQKMGPSDFVWQIMDGNISNSIILPLIIAIFVRKNK